MDMSALAGNMLADILEKSLGDVEGAEQLKDMQRKEAREDEAQRQREMKIVADALSNEAGEKFIEWLALKTVLRGANEAELGAKTAEEAAIASQRRIGQNQIFFTIVEVLNEAKRARMTAPAKPSRGKRKGSDA